MKPASEIAVAGQGHETWLPLLQLAAEEVFETGARVKNDFIALLKAVIPRIAQTV